MRPGEIFCGEIGDAAGIGSAVRFQTLDCALKDAVTNRQCEGKIKVVFCGNLLTSSECVTEIVSKRLLQIPRRNTGANRGLFHNSERKHCDARGGESECSQCENKRHSPNPALLELPGCVRKKQHSRE
jgi:hypothetical protein